LGEENDDNSVVVVRHGWTHYRVRTLFRSTTLAALKEHLALYIEVPSSQIRFVIKGKERDGDVSLDEFGPTVTVMLFFREGYHRAKEALEWLKWAEGELDEITRKASKILSQVRQNVGTRAA